MKSQVIKRGDVWLTNFDPTIGDEIKKARPAAVISRDTEFELDLIIVVPLTNWQEQFTPISWIIKIRKTIYNGLSANSAASSLQVRCLSKQRLIRKLGRLTESELEEIVSGVVFCIGG